MTASGGRLLAGKDEGDEMAVSATALRDISCDWCGAVEVIRIEGWTDGRPGSPAGWIRLQAVSREIRRDFRLSSPGDDHVPALSQDMCGRCASTVALTSLAAVLEAKRPEWSRYDVKMIRQPLAPSWA